MPGRLRIHSSLVRPRSTPLPCRRRRCVRVSVHACARYCALAAEAHLDHLSRRDTIHTCTSRRRRAVSPRGTRGHTCCCSIRFLALHGTPGCVPCRSTCVAACVAVFIGCAVCAVCGALKGVPAQGSGNRCDVEVGTRQASLSAFVRSKARPGHIAHPPGRCGSENRHSGHVTPAAGSTGSGSLSSIGAGSTRATTTKPDASAAGSSGLFFFAGDPGAPGCCAA